MKRKSKLNHRAERLKPLSLHPLTTKILCLFKVGRKEHLDLLVKGKLYCRHLAYYKRLECGEQAWQDPHEGLVAVYQSNCVNILLTDKAGNRRELSKENGWTGQVIVSADLDHPAFCVYAIHTGEWTNRSFTEAELDDFKNFLRVSDTMSAFGCHVWIVKNGDEFASRVEIACQATGIRNNHGLIGYIDAADAHGKISPELVGFAKLKKFAEQHEYRYVFLANAALPDPFILDVGSLEDITEVIPLEDFYTRMTIDYEE
jgi:hypothetical protein